MEQEGVIFLIDSKRFNKDTMRVSLEKLTNCRVYNFFSLDEASLYQKLNPKMVIYSSDNFENIADFNFSEKVDFINISNKINQEGKSFLIKHASLADKLSSMLDSDMN